MDWKAIEADMAYIDRARYVGHLLSAQADRGQKPDGSMVPMVVLQTPVVKGLHIARATTRHTGRPIRCS